MELRSPSVCGHKRRISFEVHDMKKPFLVLMSMLMLGLGGCLEPPGYSTKQRFAQIGNSMDYDLHTINDDVDMCLLLRPSSHLTDWNVIHTY
jgi:hypothetical protein